MSDAIHATVNVTRTKKGKWLGLCDQYSTLPVNSNKELK